MAAADHTNMPQLGLRQNLRQFTLLVVVNACVGGMVGMERSIFPEFAEAVFGLSSTTAVLSFIMVFGLSKAIANYYAGRLASVWGRKTLLLWGWIIGLPVPFLLLWAPHWAWVIAANLLLGISQGLAWSSTVIMKIDLVGDKQRGLAMGLNEFAGYLAVGLVAYYTAYLAGEYGVKPVPFYLGAAIAWTGLLLTIFTIRDTTAFVHAEASQKSSGVYMRNVFWETTIKNRTLSAVTQAGLVNNLNDGMIWGLLPLLLADLRYDSQPMGAVVGAYPLVWGIAQLFTGKMSDHVSPKAMLFWGMLLQGLAIILMAWALNFYPLLMLSVLLGIGTALVYPTFFTVIARVVKPEQRAESIGIFRLWRDLGYPVGALLSGIIADTLGLKMAIFWVGAITLFSAGVIIIRMPRL